MQWQLTPAPGVDVTAELQVALVGKPKLEREMRLASLLAVLNMAARGDIHPEDEAIGPIRRNPDLFELRWDFGRQKYRLYFGEPSRYPDWLVGLLFHEKDLGGTSVEINAAQNAEISKAILRFAAGESRDWGIAS